jgi:hypothetical protein
VRERVRERERFATRARAQRENKRERFILFPLDVLVRYHVPARTLIRPFVPGRRVNRGNDVTNDFEFKRARFSENGGKVHVPERRLVSVSKSDRLGRGVVAALRESVVRGG